MTDVLTIQPGELRHSIKIQAATPTRDTAGQQVDNWTTVLETRASIENTNSRTFKMSFTNNMLASQSTDAIVIRWPGAGVDLRPGMRVLYGDNRFLVQAVDNVQRRNRKVVLACMAIAEDSV
jgi:SPP1 family predicted phage head-tail adaptor